MKEVSDPYDESQYSDSEKDQDRDRQEMTKDILEMQGFDVNLENPPDFTQADSMTTMAHYAVRDADAETYYKHCKHLHVGYKPSPVGRMIGVPSFGMKYLWCQHGGFLSGANLTGIFENFKTRYCEGCEHHCPRPDDWELTDEYAEKHASDQEFQEAIQKYESIMGVQHPISEEADK